MKGKLFVQYGAGSIGRGFIGALFSEAGYDVVFIDVDPNVVAALNSEHRYPVRIVSREGARDQWISPVSAVNGRNLEAVEEIIARADMMATAVGANILPHIAPVMARGFARRWASGNREPLDILVCENLMDADHVLRDLIRQSLPVTLHEDFGKLVGLVETSIGRMVPVMTAAQKAENPLLVCVEPFRRLPVDAAAFRGALPPVPELEPQRPFRFFLERKLYLHNAGHAMTAYLGALRGYAFIHEAIGDPEIRLFVQAAMTDAAACLAARHDQPVLPLLAHVDDLLYRFGNPALGDTVARVGRDPIRKLAPDDRLTGCARMCMTQGVFPVWLLVGMAAAFRFRPDGDEAATRLQNEIMAQGLPDVLHTRCGIESEETLGLALLEAVELMKSGAYAKHALAWAERRRTT